MASLRNLASFYRSIQDEIEKNDGEVTDEVIEALNQCEDDIDTKIDSIAVLISDATMWADRHKADAAESSHMEKVKRNQVVRMKEWIRQNLDDAGIDKAGRKYPHVVRQNSIPSFTWMKVGEPIPVQFQRVKPAVIELDVKKCLEAYRAGDNSSGFLPDGIAVARGRHVQAAYKKSKERVVEDESE